MMTRKNALSYKVDKYIDCVIPQKCKLVLKFRNCSQDFFGAGPEAVMVKAKLMEKAKGA